MALQKTRFSRVKKIPKVLVPGTVYIVEDNLDRFVDMFVVDNQGNKKTIIDPSRFQTVVAPEEELSLIDYRSDINSIGTEYYYGYEYEDNSFKIISVEKGNIVNQKKALNLTGGFILNWNNRTNLTYN